MCSNCASLIMGTTKMCPTCRTPSSLVCVCVCVCVCVSVCLSACLGQCFFGSLSVLLCLGLGEFIGTHKHLY